jgi:midasin
MLVQDTVSILESLASSENHFRHLFLPIVDMLKTSLPHLSSPSPASVSSDDEAVWKKSEKLVNSFLVVAQTLRATPPKTAAPTQDAAEEAEDTPDRFVTDESSFLGKTLQHLRAEEILAQLDSFLQDAEPSSSLLTSAISRIIPFLNEYTSSAEHHLSAYTSWTHSLFKLTQIFATTTSNLALKGFCSPQEAQTGEGEGEGGKQMDGTGMGEGTGAEDVSEQIEDESQVEGLQGEDSEPQSKEEKKKESGGIEMSEDFGGELEDISQDGSDDEQDDDDKDEEDGDDAPPDEQIGDVDPLDEGAVDEKLWGDESGEQDDKDEKLDQDRSNEQSKVRSLSSH